MRIGSKLFRFFLAIGLAASFISVSTLSEAQTQINRLSIATGGTGGVVYVLGGGIARVISKYLPGTEATAEVTAASIDNCKLIHAGKADLAMPIADAAYDAYIGAGHFKSLGPVPLRALGVLYANYMHFVTLESTGIRTLNDLKGRRVSTGAPGSGAETISLKILESYGIEEKQLKRERLSVAESASALRDRKIEAFVWMGGLPTAAIMDLAASPGIKIRLLENAEHIDKLTQKYGPTFYPLTIPKTAYPRMDSEVKVVASALLLVCHEKMDASLVYNIVKVLFDHQPDLVMAHPSANEFKLERATVGSPFPFHPGAKKYYQEKGITVR
jgi:uncharacterized protein